MSSNPRSSAHRLVARPTQHAEAGASLTEAISEAIVELYGRVYGHDRTIANTYINGDVVVCVLERILTTEEARLVADGAAAKVIDGRVAFQTDSEDEFTAAVERASPVGASSRS